VGWFTSLGELLFGHRNALSWWQECNRAALVLLYGLVAVRLAGRRVLGGWSALDIIVSVVIGSNLSRALTGGAPLFGTLAASTVILVLHAILTNLAARWRWVSNLVEGRAIELGRAGRIDRRRLIENSISECDLDEALREQQVERVEDTKRVVLEPSGKITVLKSRE
jgi:uncharacterized membrane protein YcaP (DUF421 family)